MKKLFYLMAVASLFLAMPLTSCSDDDDDEVIGDSVNENGEDENDGTSSDSETINLTGVLSVTVAGEEQNPMEQGVAVTDNGDGTITLTITDFEFSGLTFGDIAVENCPLAEDGTFSGSASFDYNMMGIIAIPIYLELNGTFDGTNIVFSSEFTIEELDLTVSFTYDSTATLPESGDEGDDEPEFSSSIEYTGTVNASYSIGSIDPISDVTAVVSTTTDGETVVSIDAEISIIVFSQDLTISNIEIDCGEVDSDGTFMGTVTFALNGNEQTKEISGTIISEEDGLKIEATFNYLVDITVTFTTAEADAE